MYIVKVSNLNRSRFPVPQEPTLKHNASDRYDGLGLTVFGVVALGVGLVSGMVLSELLGNVDSDRFKSAVRRIREGNDDEPPDPEQIERDLLSALRGNPTTRQAEIDVHAFGEGLIEMEGIVTDERTRDIALELASSVTGVDDVVNRILVEGADTHERPAATMESKS